jgi:hypothetical protein
MATRTTSDWPRYGGARAVPRPGLTGLRPDSGDTVTVYDPLFRSQANKRSRNIAPLGNPAQLHPPRGGAVLRQRFGFRANWTYRWST